MTRVRTRALIMAGGKGIRLRPLTDDTPKPMLTVAGIPIIERIVRQLHRQDITEVYVALGWLGEQIEAHFGGRVQYTHEKEPLGTIGAMQLLPFSRDPTLVLNGDVLTPDLDYRRLIDWHEAAKVSATIVQRAHSVPLAWGVATVDPDTGLVTNIREKPTIHYPTLSGVYVVGSDCPAPVGHADAPDYLDNLRASGMRVSTYPCNGRWIDIGSPADYKRAEGMFADG